MAPRASRSATPLHEPVPEEPITAARLGWLSAAGPGGAVLVDYPGNGRGPIAAVAVLQLDPGELADAIRRRRPAVLLFDGGDPSRPIVLGLAGAGAATELLQEILSVPATAPSAAPPPAAARVDGRRVVIEGREEVVLRCGEATITLTRDGKVTVRGARIVSTARGTHRIRGGAVQIN